MQNEMLSMSKVYEHSRKNKGLREWVNGERQVRQCEGVSRAKQVVVHVQR